MESFLALEATPNHRTGAELWTWLRSSNPIVEHLLAELAISDSERRDIEAALEQRVRDRAGNDGRAVLTSPINFGIGVKTSKS